MKKLFVPMIFSLLVAGCDQPLKPITTSAAATSSPTASPAASQVPPEVEPGTGKPIEVQWSNPERAPDQVGPPIGDRTRDPWGEFKKNCESRGGTYLPPSRTFGQTLANGRKDVTGAACQTTEERGGR